MGWFKQKEVYKCKILEKYKIDIEKACRTSKSNYKEGQRVSLFGGEYCELVAECNDYRFYAYKPPKDRFGIYILRQEKASPKKVVYFGYHRTYNVVFKGYLFQVDNRGIDGFGGEDFEFGITARNVIDGSKISFNWLSQKYLYIGHAPSQDAVNSVVIEDDKLIFNVTRYKVDSEEFDEYNRDTVYKLVVQYVSGKFKANAIFPPVEDVHKEEKSEED